LHHAARAYTPVVPFPPAASALLVLWSSSTNSTIKEMKNVRSGGWRGLVTMQIVASAQEFGCSNLHFHRCQSINLLPVGLSASSTEAGTARATRLSPPPDNCDG